MGSPSVEAPTDDREPWLRPAGRQSRWAHKPIPKPLPRAPAPDPVKRAEADSSYGRGVPQDCDRALSIAERAKRTSPMRRTQSALGSMSPPVIASLTAICRPPTAISRWS